METDFNEIDEGIDYVGYQRALDLVYANIPVAGVEEVPLDSCVGRIAAEDVVALLSYPSGDVSLKDGYAVTSGDIADASRQRPVRLRIIGSAFAGCGFTGKVTPGSAVKVCSGAAIPSGADAVVSGEFCEEISPDEVCIMTDAQSGRNILRAGGEIKAGETIIEKGGTLRPGCLGLAAAAGISLVKVYRRPKVAVVAVGDEVVAPGGHLHLGQLYASNLVTIASWLSSFGIGCATSVVRDDTNIIRRELLAQTLGVDVVLTSGGAWGSERDLVVGVLDDLGWQMIFLHVRMGPGKGIAFGLWKDKPVFCLPGGPASNEMAFLQLALPGIIRMSGDKRHPLRTVFTRLAENIRGRNRAWTEFKDAVLSRDAKGNYTVELYKNRSRLQAIARANSLVCIPEGTESLRLGDIIPVQILAPSLSEL